MNNYQILIVEDDETWMDIIEKEINNVLKNRNIDNYQVTKISCFKDAQQALELKHWDLFIADIGLGDHRESLRMTGRILVDISKDKKIPTIVVSETNLTRTDVGDLFSTLRVRNYFDKENFIRFKQDFPPEVLKALSNQNISPPSPENIQIDFAIITAIRIERLAVLRAFEIDETTDRVRKDSRTYWRKRLSLNNGKFYEIVVAQSLDMANLNAAVLTNDVLHNWKPNAVVMVGIAATAKPSTRQNLGDLVIGKEIYYYEMGRVTSEGILPEPKQIPADSTLLDRVQALPTSDFIVLAERPDGTTKHPEIEVGVIASGDRVIADATERDKIAAVNRKIMAIEMEGYGVIASTSQSFERVRCLVIRGLCDYADSTKNDGWHAYAAAVAAGYTKYFLLDEPLEPRNPTLPS
jgi:nucleoside phosphorylase/CheY-like chemotaxis protein